MNQSFRLDATDVVWAVKGLSRWCPRSVSPQDRRDALAHLKSARHRLSIYITELEKGATIVASTFDVAVQDLSEGDRFIMSVRAVEQVCTVLAITKTSRKYGKTDANIWRVIYESDDGEVWTDFDGDGLVRVVDEESDV